MDTSHFPQNVALSLRLPCSSALATHPRRKPWPQPRAETTVRPLLNEPLHSFFCCRSHVLIQRQLHLWGRRPLFILVADHLHIVSSSPSLCVLSGGCLSLANNVIRSHGVSVFSLLSSIAQALYNYFPVLFSPPFIFPSSGQVPQLTFLPPHPVFKFVKRTAGFISPKYPR